MSPRYLINAGLSINPNDSGLPGIAAAKNMVGALITYGFIACVIAVVLGAAGWALGSRMGNPHHAEKGRYGVLFGAFGAALIGSSVGLVNFFSNVSLT